MPIIFGAFLTSAAILCTQQSPISVGRISVTVQDENCDALPGAQVFFGTTSEDEMNRSVVAVEDGVAIVEFDASKTLRLLLLADEYGAAGRSWKAGFAPEAVTVCLKKGTSISGRIVWDDTGEPVQGAELKLGGTTNLGIINGSRGVGSTRISVSVDATGRWRFPYALRGRAESQNFYLKIPTNFGLLRLPYRALKTERVIASGGDEYRVPPVIYHDVQVLADRKPAANATVLSSVGELSRANGPIAQTTNDKGEVVVPGVADTITEVVAITEECGPKSLVLVPWRSNRKSIIGLRKTGSVKLRVVDLDGNPIPNAYVNAQSDGGLATAYHHRNQTKYADKQGRWTMKPRPPGRLKLSVSAPGCEHTYFYPKQTEEVQEVVIYVYPKVAITGRVVDDSTGQPIKMFGTSTPLVDTGEMFPGSTQPLRLPAAMTAHKNFSSHEGTFDLEFPFNDRVIPIPIIMNADGYEPNTFIKIRSAGEHEDLEIRLTPK